MNYIKYDIAGNIQIVSTEPIDGANVIQIENLSDDFFSTFALGKYLIINNQISEVQGWAAPVFVNPFIIPSETVLANAKKAKEVELRAIGAKLMIQVVTPYTAEERDTWPSQVAEAKAYIIDNNIATPMLSALVIGRGNTVLDQATRILNNEIQFKVATGTILGIQQHKIDLVNAATTIEEVNTIVWEA